MYNKSVCDIRANNLEKDYSVCIQLSFVDETKTDEEYNCSKCKDN